MRKSIAGIGAIGMFAAASLTIAAVALPGTESGISARSVQSQRADTFTVDNVHSSVVFKVKHVGVSWVYGRFNDVSGTVIWNADDPTKSSINAEVKATSVDTNSSGRDNHLRGPDFFDVANFPTASFVSNSIKAAGQDKFTVTGDFTMHGVTKPITVTIEKVGLETLPRFGTRLGLAAEFTIKRSDFGMTYGVDGPVGDEVTIMFGLECAAES